VYIPDDHLLWDFWIIRHREKYHLYYLQAPRNLSDPEDRHAQATVGHAVSPDLRSWSYQGTALTPGPPGGWDDRAIWTGSVISEGDRFLMLYTGTCRSEGGRIQRIGLATSTDLRRWHKFPANPVIESEPATYEDESASPFRERAWRDPYLVRQQGSYCAYITSRVRNGPLDGRGCIALARSPDAHRWKVLPPVYAPGMFGQMEIPQLIQLQGRYFLLFGVELGWHAHSGEVPKTTGTYYANSHDPERGYTEPRLLLGDVHGQHYGTKLVEGPDNTWYILSWLRHGPRGDFVGGLSDPQPVELRSGGIIAIKGATRS